MSMHPLNDREIEMARFTTCCSMSATAGALAKLWGRKNEEAFALPTWRLYRRWKLIRELDLLMDLYDVMAEEEQVQGR